ncbi:unnamed protein product, partial [Ectocarpus sp. 4 AP-2014]
ASSSGNSTIGIMNDLEFRPVLASASTRHPRLSGVVGKTKVGSSIQARSQQRMPYRTRPQEGQSEGRSMARKVAQRRKHVSVDVGRQSLCLKTIVETKDVPVGIFLGGAHMQACRHLETCVCCDQPEGGSEP